MNQDWVIHLSNNCQNIYRGWVCLIVYMTFGLLMNLVKDHIWRYKAMYSEKSIWDYTHMYVASNFYPSCSYLKFKDILTANHDMWNVEIFLHIGVKWIRKFTFFFDLYIHLLKVKDELRLMIFWSIWNYILGILMINHILQSISFIHSLQSFLLLLVHLRPLLKRTFVM